MHDKHEDKAAHDANPWPDRINEAYYDKMGADFGRQTRDRINWMCSQARGTTVLDVGCSQGIAAVLLAREGFHVLGLDISEPAIEYANRERGSEIETVRERLTFRCGELASLEDACYDTVLMGEVVEHQTNPVRFIRVAASHVAPGGRIVITVPYGLHPWPDHKSTIFPRDLHEALAGEFAPQTIEVTDDYIRVVADRRRADEVVGNDMDVLLRATETGALDAQSSYYAANATAQEHAKARGALESSLKAMREEHGKLAVRHAEIERDLAVGAEHANGLRDALERARQTIVDRGTEYAEALRGQREEQMRVQEALTDAHARRVDELLQQVTALQMSTAELQATERMVAGSVEALQQEVELLRAAEGERPRALHEALEAAHARAQELQGAADELKGRMRKLTEELVDAQAKRSGHWAKLEAEQARSKQLIELAQSLHEESQRYEHSIALAIGRAILGLGSVRGIIGFPRAMARVVRLYQRRRDGTLQMAQLALPSLPNPKPVATVADDGAARGLTPMEEAPRPRNEEQKKKLAMIGWEQENSRGSLPVMSVLDEFSRACFAPHANLIEARPDNWDGLLEKFSPRFLLAESAWRGNRGTWCYRVASTEYAPGNEFAQMVEGFRKRGVPTIFWNKEDPVHFDAFIESASRCDVVLTTSAESIERYRSKTKARVEVMQFAAEDSLHNPQGSSRRNGKVCFAGSYYAQGFEARQHSQSMLLEAAKAHDLDIYDRNHRAVGARSEFAFPEDYAPYIRGRLGYEDLSRKYREYQVFLNVNSVDDSSTMFSRRVFELLACGTPVVSTWSRGIAETFGNDIVWQVRSQAEAEEALRMLTTDPVEWRRRSLAGIRAVLARHTYRHRFDRILSLVGERAGQGVQLIAIAEVADQAEANAALVSFRRQQTTDDIRRQLLLVCRNGFRLEGQWPDVRTMSDTQVPLAQLIDWERESAPGAVVAVLSPHAVYGCHYLQDAMHAVRYSGALVVGKAVDGTEYEWGQALDPRTLVVNTAALGATGTKAGGLLDAQGGLAPSFVSKTYASDSANFAAVHADADRDALLQKIEV
ncbi:glycosyltransferase [Lysobacter cavernae]|uniref:Glycosyltransferase n=1 Tax=Lysobacter cavernae TaxID=1685901 RepID=A0ABV7RPR0_9GAMM